MRRRLVPFLAALLLASSALAATVPRLVTTGAKTGGISPQNGNTSPPASGPVQNKACNSGSNPFCSPVLGGSPTVGRVLWAIGASHHGGGGTCLSVNTAAGWVAQTNFNPGVLNMAIAYRIVLAGDSATQTPFLDNGTCSGASSNAVDLWEIGGLNTSTPLSNVAYSTAQDGISVGITPNYSYTSASDNNFALFANFYLNGVVSDQVSALSGSPWTDLITSGFVTNGGDYGIRYSGGVFTGTTAGSKQFQAGFLVLKP